jgi:dihydrofolate synthase/folylpolyglutamate synthase
MAAAILARLLPGPAALYTSPHLLSPTERIRTDGVPVGEEELARLLRRVERLNREVRPLGHGDLSWFEAMTAAAFLHFSDRGARYGVIETGLGGRWDATSACTPLVNVVTTVGVDHAEWLGTTLPAIAAEKAAIFREGVPVVTGPLRPSAARVVRRAARALSCPAWEFGRDFGRTEGEGGKVRFLLPGLAPVEAAVPLRGEFQKDNAAVAAASALAFARRLGVGDRAFAAALPRALPRAAWPGRFSLLCRRKGAATWVDGAHNPEGAEALAREIARERAQGRFRPLVAVVGMLADKDRDGILSPLAAHLDGMVAFPVAYERGAGAEWIAEGARKAGLIPRTAPSFDEAHEAALSLAGKGGTVLVCGSLFAVAEAYGRLGGSPG